MNLVKYVVRENNGRFSNYRKVCKKIIIKQLIIISVLMNLFLAHKMFVVRCAAGGLFMSTQACGDEAEAKFDSTQLAQTQNELSQLQNNSDLYR